MTIAANLNKVLEQIPESVCLVAVSKTKPNADIQEAYAAGQRIFGENKVQELVDKYEALPKDIQWHLIGHLQTNKVKHIAPFVSLIHAVDSLKLLTEINKRAAQNNRIIDCLLQIKLGSEETKFGLGASELDDVLKNIGNDAYPNVRITGLMGMASNTSDEAQITREFNSLSSLFNKLKKELSTLNHLSMGMSGDYALAITAGSNMVRIGSSIFGQRNYQL